MALSAPAIATRINLTFHGVGRPPCPLEPSEGACWVTTDRFLAILDTVRTRPDVRITFDDSNRSDVEVVLPALVARGLTATFFVLAGRLHDPRHLAAADVRALAAEGMTIGTHGMDHVDWRTARDSVLERELGTARRRLEAICGRPVREAAIPFGRYDRRVLDALRRHGYARVFTSDGGGAHSSSWLQPRNSLRRDDGPLQVASILAAERSAGVSLARGAKRAIKRWR